MKLLNPITDIGMAQCCQERWQDLKSFGPNHRIRRCPHCGVRVYNVSGLDTKQAMALIAGNEPHPLKKVHIRADGTLVAEDRYCRKRSKRRLLARLCAMFGMTI
jgi:hypothetical protein